MKKNIKTILILGVLLVCISLIGGYYSYINRGTTTQPPIEQPEELFSTTTSVESVSFENKQSTNTLINSSIDDKLKNIFETRRSAGEIADLDTYIVSPDNKYLLVKYFNKRGENVYFFYNLETNIEIRLPWSEYYGQNALTEILWKTDESYALLPSEWSGYGGDSFTGILKIDLENEKFTRLLDKGVDCKQDKDWADCVSRYKYILEKIEGSTLYYTERVYKKGTYIDEDLYTDERKTLIIK